MFSIVTILNAMNLHIPSICYTDNRAFPGVDTTLAPGPLGYQLFISHEALTIIPNAMFTLSSWLADGLLVSRLFSPAFTCPGA